MSDAVLVEKADGQGRDLDGEMTAAGAERSDLRGMFRGLQTESRALHTEVSTGLVDAVRMAKHNIT